MGLHWGAPCLKSLIPDEFWSRIQSVQVDPSRPPTETDHLDFMNAQSGEVMASIPVPFFYRLRRRKLRGLLVEGLDVRFGMRVVDVRYHDDDADRGTGTGTGMATALFQDGSSITARLIVGADGARSVVRQSLLGPVNSMTNRLPYCATFAHAKFPAERALFLRKFHPLYLAGIHPAGYFSFFGLQHAPDPDNPETWTFFFYISWYSSLQEQDETAHWTNAQRLAQVKQFAKQFTDPWKSAFEWLPDDHPVWCIGLTDFDPGADGHRWWNRGGRLTLAGDAAHSMTYQRGQGLNNSITDAALLLDAVKGFVGGQVSQEVAITSYEDEMIARAGGEVRLSTANTGMLHDWQKVLQSPVLTSGLSRSHCVSG